MKRLEIKNTKMIKGNEHTRIEVLEIRDLFNGEHSLVIRKISSVNGRTLQDETWSWSNKESWEEQIEDLNQKIIRYAETRQAEEDEDPIGDVITLTDAEDIPNPEKKETNTKYYLIQMVSSVTGKNKIQYRKYKCSDGWTTNPNECWQFTKAGALKKVESLKKDYHVNYDKGLIKFNLVEA